jgi:hypothetical protein
MMFTQLWRMALTRTGEFNGRQEWLPRQNPLLLFTGGRCGQTNVALPDADFVRTRRLDAHPLRRRGIMKAAYGYEVTRALLGTNRGFDARLSEGGSCEDQRRCAFWLYRQENISEHTPRLLGRTVLYRLCNVSGRLHVPTMHVTLQVCSCACGPRTSEPSDMKAKDGWIAERVDEPFPFGQAIAAESGQVRAVRRGQSLEHGRGTPMRGSQGEAEGQARVSCKRGAQARGQDQEDRECRHERRVPTEGRREGQARCE